MSITIVRLREIDEIPSKKETSMFMKFEKKKYKYQTLKFNVIKTEHWFEMINSEYFKASFEKYDEIFKSLEMQHLPISDYSEFMDHLIPNNVTIDNFKNIDNHCNWKYVRNPKRKEIIIPHRWQNLSGDFYQPFVLRYKISIITGERLNTEALCPYCPCTHGKYNSNFHSIKNADYLHHVTKTHMVYSNGTEIEIPHLGKSWDDEIHCICGPCGKTINIGKELDLTSFIKHSWKHSKISILNMKLPAKANHITNVDEPPFERKMDTNEWVKDGLTRFGHAKGLVWSKLIKKRTKKTPKKCVEFNIFHSDSSDSLQFDLKRLDAVNELNNHEQNEDQYFSSIDSLL